MQASQLSKSDKRNENFYRQTKARERRIVKSKQVQNKRRHGVYFFVGFLKKSKTYSINEYDVKKSKTVLNYVDDNFRVTHC